MKHFSSFKKVKVLLAAFFMLASIPFLSPALTVSALTHEEVVVQQEKDMDMMEQYKNEAKQMEEKVSELQGNNLAMIADMQKVQENPTTTPAVTTTYSDSYLAALEKQEAIREENARLAAHAKEQSEQVAAAQKENAAAFNEMKEKNDKLVVPMNKFVNKIGFLGFFIIVLISGLLGMFVRCIIQYKVRKWLMKDSTKDSSSKSSSTNKPSKPTSTSASNSTTCNTTNSTSNPASNPVPNPTPNSTPNPVPSSSGKGSAVMS